MMNLLKLRDEIYSPLFSVKDVRLFIPGLTYRQVNSWGAKGMICDRRENKRFGWRRFSIADAVRLKVVWDLRRHGFSSQKIKRIVGCIRDDYMLGCLGKQRTYLLVSKLLRGVLFVPQRDLLERSRFVMEHCFGPVILLPLFEYVQEITFGLTMRRRGWSASRLRRELKGEVEDGHNRHHT